MDEASLYEILECSVCLEQLDTTSKVLPCQHLFCKRCLEEIVHSHKELRCPECRVLVEVAVDDLPSNILLIRILEGIKNNPRSSVRVTNTPSKKSDSSVSGRLPLASRAPPVSELPSRSSLISELPSRVSLATELPSRAIAVSEPSRVSLVPDQLRRRAQPEVLEQRTPSKQILQSSPCAKAVYTYEGKEPGDLSFKKGDLIILHKRIDQNWYHGESNGKVGFLPARYVQVMVPLPTHVPQCKALYDFSVANNDEKDCLVFKKGEVITVIRRVDDNWAEGKLADRIGIFPISFVEMNVAARSLMKLSVNTQPGPSRVAPPTPTVESSQDSTITVSKLVAVTSNSNLPALDLLSSAATTPSPTSSSATSPSTLSSSSSSASLTTKVPVTESSPSVLMRSSSQRSTQEREKRHSLSSLSSSPSCTKSSHIPVTHRHSAEILSTSGGDVLVAPKVPSQTSSPSATKNVGTDSLAVPSNTAVEQNGPRIIRRHSHKETDENKPHVVPKSVAVSGSSTTSSTSPITVQSPSPTYYMALYNYRPQKEDELELKKGEMYVVSEKCQDGWFKGTSVLNGHSGVFPGNYVHFAKMPGIQTNPFHPSHASAVNSRTNKSQLPIANASRCKSAVLTPQPGNNPFTSAILNSEKSATKAELASFLVRPRPLPRETRTSVAAGLLEWARSVAAVNNPPLRPHRGDASQEGEQLITPSQAPLLEGVSPVPSVTDTSPWVSRLSTCSQFPTPPVNSATVQPTSMAASYPSSSLGTQAQPDPASFPTKISQSWHGTRTFSHSQAPSLSVASPPNVSLRAPVPLGIRQPHSKSDKHKGRKDKSRESLMKRLTSKRKSRSPPVDLSCDNPSFVDSPSTHAAVSPIPVAHARSDSCPADILSVPSSDQKSQANSSVPDPQKPGSRLKQPSAVRERFRCVVPYPPNSDYELELKVGDIVYVHKKRDDGWYKGTLLRTGKTGLFPASFVDSY